MYLESLTKLLVLRLGEQHSKTTFLFLGQPKHVVHHVIDFFARMQWRPKSSNGKMAENIKTFSVSYFILNHLLASCPYRWKRIAS